MILPESNPNVMLLRQNQDLGIGFMLRENEKIVSLHAP